MRYLLIICTLLIASPYLVNAQAQVYDALKETVSAEVLTVTDSRTRTVPGTDTQITTQDVKIRLLEGEQAGAVKEFENELATLAPGDKIFVNRVVMLNGFESIILMDVDRRGQLIILGVLAITLLLAFTGMHGVRAIFSLGLSIGAIIFLLIPALLAGYEPALVSLVIAGLVLALVLFITHGINPRSVTAFIGTWSAVLFTCVIAYISVYTMRLTGFSSDAAVSLNFATQGTLDFSGLLLGSIIIGILGILDDVAITQASVVQELKAANSALGATELYKRAINVGRDHIGSLVNTLALAYVGVSLPLLLLFARAETDLAMTINQEIVAVEIVRIIIGSIGLLLAVPLTTFCAAWWFGKQTDVAELTATHHHHHHHSH